MLIPGIIILVFALGWLAHPGIAPSPLVDPANTFSTKKSEQQTPFFHSSFSTQQPGAFVHSPAITALPTGQLLTVWFSGSREGGKDVVIKGSIFDPRTQEWSSELTLTDRHITMDGVNRYVRKLGNPVVATAPSGRLWLFYVSVAIGGWGGSAINISHSDDQGASWSLPKRLITSPFINISTLVRSTPLFHEDGSIGLPVYHEFMGKFAEYLYLDADGDVLNKYRISKGKHSLQPTIAALSGQRAVALLRYAGKPPSRVLASISENAGRTWSTPVPLSISNPNASLAIIASADGHADELLVALNNLERDRFQLTLLRGDKTLTHWKHLYTLDESPEADGQRSSREDYTAEIRQQFLKTASTNQRTMLDDFMATLDYRTCRHDGCEFDYEYPYFFRCPQGLYHVVYSWNNSMIKYVSFNEAWLESTQRERVKIYSDTQHVEAAL